MKQRPDSLRLLLEVLAIVGVAEGVVLLSLHTLVPGWQGWRAALLNAAGLAMLCAPLIYWRGLAAHHRIQAREGKREGKRSASASAAWAMGLAMGTQLAGLGLTVLAVLWARNVAETEVHGRYQQHAERIERAVMSRFTMPLYGLRGARAFYNASDQISRAEFRTFIETRDLDREFPGVRGFGFIKHVMRAELAEFTARERADGAPDFSVKTSGQAPDMYVTKFIEPVARNRPAVGLDVGAEAVRRDGVERAIASGQPTLTGRITLVQDGKKGPGFLYLLPVFGPGPDLSTPTQRAQALRGLVFAPIAVSELLQGAADAADRMLDLELFEGQAASAEKLLYDSDGHVAQIKGAIDVTQHYEARRYVTDRELTIGGLTLLLRTSTTPIFDASIDRRTPVVIGVGGAALSLLAAVAVWLLAVGRVRAQAQAERMTADLDRLATVVRHTTNRVIVTDAMRRITWVNPAYERHAGRTLEGLRGSSLTELLVKADNPVNPQLLALLRAIDAGESYRGELAMHGGPQGKYWVDVDMQPLRNGAGEITAFMLIKSDVTERVLVQEHLESVLRDNAALLQTLHTHAIVSVTDRHGVITEVNDAFCRISGYQREELIGSTHALVNSDQHSKEFWADFWSVISSGAPWRGEICNRNKDGQLYWVDSMVAPFIGADGFVEKYVFIRTDITASKTSLLKLEQASAQLQLAIEGGSDGLWDWVNIRAHDEWWSPQFYRLLGYEPGEIDSTRVTFDHMLHPEHREATFEAITLALKGERAFDVEYRLRTKSGEYRWFRSRAKVHFDAHGEPQRMAGSIQDIHERKCAAAALAETTALLTAVLASATKLAVIATDPQLTITMFNRGAEQMLGYSAQEMVSLQTPVPLHDASEMRQRAQEMAQQLGRPIDGPAVFTDDSVLGRAREWTYLRKDGSGVPVSLLVTAMTDAQGHIFGYLGIAQDISERRQYEDSLKEARERAEQASQAKSQFLANMSHEIRTPMNAILGMLKLLQTTPLTPRQADYAGKTEGAARSLLTLLNDILDFSKVEAGKMVLDRHAFRLETLLRDLSVILSASVKRKSVEVIFEVDPALPQALMGDSMRLQQILINLGGNAIKFTEQGEVHLRIAVAQQAGGELQVAFSVRDTGIGIAPENQAHIFQGFTQAEASTTRRYGGTGLGLVISRRLVQLMGGELALHSELGVGTTFSFVLPMSACAAPKELPPAREPALGVRALVVDDNPLTRSAMSAMLLSLGWHVGVAASGGEALSRVAQARGTPQAPQVIYVDWRMPTMDGWETARRLREQWVGPGAPLVIMVTAHNADTLSQREPAEQALLDGFVTKPVTATMLHDAMVDARLLRENPHAALLAPKGSRHRLQGMRLLVVEDNRNNQQVAQELLSDEGAHVTLASNGQEGVNAVARAAPAFDAVLMDLQMPVMDGHTATALIRNQLGLTQLPVIAMTANAMAGDREACLAAGMNDHVGKPFDLDQLVETLLHHTGRGASGAAPQRAERALPEELLAYGQAHGIEVQTALHRMGGKLPAYLRVLRNFVNDLAPMPAELAAHFAQGRHVDAARLAHTLKGMAGTVGLPGLAQLAADVESQTRVSQGGAPSNPTPPLDALGHAVVQASEHLAHVIDSLQHLADTSAASATSPAVDTTTLALELATLHRLLEQADMQALDVHERLHASFAPALGDELQPLDDAMAALDFPRALALCASLREHLTALPENT